MVILVWLALYGAVMSAGLPPDARSSLTAFEAGLPVWERTEAVYFLTYPFVLLAPCAARTRRDLRALAVQALLACGLIFPLYLAIPLIEDPCRTGCRRCSLMRREAACPFIVDKRTQSRLRPRDPYHCAEVVEKQGVQKNLGMSRGGIRVEDVTFLGFGRQYIYGGMKCGDRNVGRRKQVSRNANAQHQDVPGTRPNRECLRHGPG